MEFIVHIFLGPLLCFIAFIFKKFPPKKINGLYGYRTPKSMKSQELWDFANAYSADLMFKLSLGLIIIQAISIPLINELASLLLSLLLMISIPIYVIIRTEILLKKKEDLLLIIKNENEI